MNKKTEKETKPMTATPLDELRNIINNSTSDIYFYAGDIDSNLQGLRNLICKHPDKKNEVDLFLVTNGGDPNWAYRIVSTLRTHYEKLNVIVPGACKSAGTLIAFGADTLRFHEYGELGPLDVQTKRKDDLFQRNSGLDVFQAISVINQSASGCFHNMFLEFLANGRGTFSTETAAKIATDLATGIYSSIASKIDPLELGEKNRAMNIAKTYGNQLECLTHTPNSKSGTLDKLIGNYPSHGFVIDMRQAQELFNRVDIMTDNDYRIYNLFISHIVGFNPNTLVIHDLIADYRKLLQEERISQNDTESTISQNSDIQISCSVPNPKPRTRAKPKTKKTTA